MAVICGQCSRANTSPRASSALPQPAALIVSRKTWLGAMRADAAHKALHRVLKDSAAAGLSDLDALDPAVLRTARQQIHQGVGALELAGLSAGATLLRASEAVVQKFVNRPQAITEDAVRDVEKGSFALLDYIGRKLAGKPLSSLIETKRLMKGGYQQEVLAKMDEEGQSFGRMLREPAAKEAFGAFMEKRKPDFSKL